MFTLPLRLIRFLALFCSATTLFWPDPGQAASTARSQHTGVELLAETNSIAPGEPFLVALRMKMDPHWHTYWINPGDSGLATTIVWELPPGFTAGPIQWPAPARIETGGLVSYGYEGEIFLLTQITPPARLNTGSRLNLKARVDWLECEDICIPGSADLALALPTSSKSSLNARVAGIFARARQALPEAPLPRLRFEDRGAFIALVLEEASQPLGPPAAFFVHQERAINYAAPQELRARGRALELLLPQAENSAHPGALSGVLKVESPGGTRAYAVPLTPVTQASASPSHSTPGDSGFLAVLALGFIGGLILNLMPCVFPVLGLKIMGLVRQSGEARSRVVRHGLGYTGGVLVSFWIMAGVLLSLRSSGAQLGWGFQLQEPGFVFILAAVMLLFGLNMSGVFEIGGSLVGTGSKLTAQPTLRGSFFSGVLATVVATPCAAPFLAPALGAALTLPPLPSLTLFTSIGLGLASPFLLLSLAPDLVRHLPKPGAWMETLKQGLAFLLYAAAAYLIWVLAGQADESHFLSALFGLVLLAAGAWIYGRTASPVLGNRTRLIGLSAALATGLTGLIYGWPSSPSPQAIVWEPWSGERVSQLQSEGRPIYVDFTARWCATCQVNKRVVFGSKEVVGAFRKARVATLKADWTNQDPAITTELARWGRSAVPFNLLYLPGRPHPIELPEILTPSIVLESLNVK